MNMVNNVGKVGAVGVIPWFAQRFYPILLLKVDSGEFLLVRLLLVSRFSFEVAISCVDIRELGFVSFPSLRRYFNHGSGQSAVRLSCVYVFMLALPQL